MIEKSIETDWNESVEFWNIITVIKNVIKSVL